VKQLVNVLIAVILAAALSGFSILPPAEAGPVAGDSILEFSTVIEKQGDQEGASESPETESKYSFKQIAVLLASENRFRQVCNFKILSNERMC